MTLPCLTDTARKLHELAKEGKNERNMEVVWGGEEYGRGTRMDYAEGDIQGGRG